MYEGPNFEPEFESIKTNPNKYWEEHTLNILCRIWLRKYGAGNDIDDLVSDSYLWYIDYCQKYYPYIKNQFNELSFIPFDAYIFFNLKWRVFSICRDNNKRKNREMAWEFINEKSDKKTAKEFNYKKSLEDTIIDKMSMNELVNDLTKKINPRKLEIVKMISDGYKQKEVAEKFKISQSRVCIIQKEVKEKMKPLKDLYT